MAIMTATITNAQNPDFLKMVEYATKAPSGHNTQPWKFKITETSIEIYPDLSCALSVVDNDNRELYISLGCALENLCIAANNLGYQENVTINKKDSIHIICVDLEKTNNNLYSSLFAQIEKRQTNRSLYNNKKITADTLQFLQDLKLQENTQLYFYPNGSENYTLLANFVKLGNDLQMSNKNFKKELLSWMRFNKKDVSKKNNGLSYATMEAPALPAWMSKPIIKSYLKPKKQNQSDLKKIASSSHIVLFTLMENTPRNWIETGRSLERFLLKCTELGIAIAYLNQPCEEKTLAAQIQSNVLKKNEIPVLLLRIGYASPLPYSPRKPIEKVIVE